MEKGKYGIRLSFYAVAAFLLAIFGGGYIPLFLLAGVAIIGEKNEWVSRQIIEAICLSFMSSIIYAFLDIFDFFYKIPFFGSIWGTIISVINSIVNLGILIFAIIALVNVSKGKEANVPLASKFANWAYGKVVVKPVYVQQPVYQQPVQPMQQAPVQQAAPAQPVQTAPAADVCANCGAPLNGAAFCTKCGTPKAN